MSAEIVYPLQSLSFSGNCIVDTSGRLHTVNHLFSQEPEDQNPAISSTNGTNGIVWLTEKYARVLKFFGSTGLDYARTQEALPNQFLLENPIPFATSIPEKPFNIKIRTSYPVVRERQGKAQILMVERRGYKTTEKIVFSGIKTRKGESGSPVLIVQPAVSGPQYSQHHAEERILGLVITDHCAEISPDVRGVWSY
jgi:hypothetical protein